MTNPDSRGWNARDPEGASIMLTKKGKYGLKAAVHLARLPVGQSAFVADIAEANMIPKKFLDAILGELRNAGMLHSKKGKGGGYMLAKPAESIVVGDIVRVLDGPLAPLSCASTSAYRRCDDCTDEKACSVRLMMLDVRNAIAEVLDRRSLAEMRDLPGDIFETLPEALPPKKAGSRAARRKNWPRPDRDRLVRTLSFLKGERIFSIS
jgi:Rrf2 family protein